MAETRPPAALSRMSLAELKEFAQSLGITVAPKARKADLLEAIKAVRGPSKRGRPRKNPVETTPSAGNEGAASVTPVAGAVVAAGAGEASNAGAADGVAAEAKAAPREAHSASSEAREVAADVRGEGNEAGQRGADSPRRSLRGSRQRRSMNETGRSETSDAQSEGASASAQAENDGTASETSRHEGARENYRNERRRGRAPRTTEEIVLPEAGEAAERRQNRADRRTMSEDERRATLDAITQAAERKGSEDEENSRYNRRSRGRGKGRRGGDTEAAAPTPQEEEVLIPVAGILDVEGNQAFLRTGGYLPGSNDAIVSAAMVKQYGLRRGDAIVGAVRQRGEHENNNYRGRGNRRFNNNNHHKYNPLVHIESINSLTPEQSAQRPEFNKLTPLYPQDMLRLETTQKALTARAIDLVAPIGKGQRGLIVAPPKAGKTIIMQQIAMAIAANNPQVHLMVVLVDERPEEVTDMKRLVKGEVIASTFDRPASDHTIVAELAIERAKRLVELGQDVVVLLDSLTRLSRAYNLAAPASGRILSGGVDAGALYPPKKFFGAARNIENGGSLTIIASALVETGSKMDEVIFEEFKGTGNMELRLSRQLADRRIFPAIDVNASGTRREELLYTPEELKIIWQLRRALGTLEVQEASDFVLGRMRKTETNADFLVQLMRSMQAGA